MEKDYMNNNTANRDRERDEVPRRERETKYTDDLEYAYTDIITRPVKHNFATPPQHISYEQVYISGNNIKFNSVYCL